MTTMHLARVNTCSGIPLSRALATSFRTLAELLRRCAASSLAEAAQARLPSSAAKLNTPRTRSLFMIPSLRNAMGGNRALYHRKLRSEQAAIRKNVDDVSGWVACSACADWGVTSNYWYKQGGTSPSKDGKSMVMYIKGAYGVWADDLFIKALGDQTWARHIEWGLDLLWDAPNNHTKQSNGKYVVQAIELDTRMIIGDWKYHFGIQCNYATSTWDMWDNVNKHWIHQYNLP